MNNESEVQIWNGEITDTGKKVFKQLSSEFIEMRLRWAIFNEPYGKWRYSNKYFENKSVEGFFIVVIGLCV